MAIRTDCPSSAADPILAIQCRVHADLNKKIADNQGILKNPKGFGYFII